MNVVAGCLISGGIELATQMIVEGKSLGCVDWWSIALEIALGCNPFSKGLKAGKAAKGAACAANSLVAGTLVHTEEGLVPIELVKVGDKVLSWDERTGERSYQAVLELIQHEGTYELVKVTLENGEQLEATSGHPFYVQGKGWNAAANLKVGDALLLHNGTTVVVATVDSRVGWERVYNFSVAGNANYFVGSGGVGVHNCSSIKNMLRPEKKYYGSKKHGINWKEGPATARKTGDPQGQWGGEADLNFAAEKASTLKSGEGAWFDLPEGHTSVVHMPNGVTVPATKIWVRNNGTGTFHGYPAP